MGTFHNRCTILSFDVQVVFHVECVVGNLPLTAEIPLLKCGIYINLNPHRNRTGIKVSGRCACTNIREMTQQLHTLMRNNRIMLWSSSSLVVSLNNSIPPLAGRYTNKKEKARERERSGRPFSGLVFLATSRRCCRRCRSLSSLEMLDLIPNCG